MQWDPAKFPLFISHTSAFKSDVGALKLALVTEGVDAFVAHNDIEPTKEWQDEIEMALATCEALVAWLTPDFRDSSWTAQEIGYVIRFSARGITGVCTT